MFRQKGHTECSRLRIGIRNCECSYLDAVQLVLSTVMMFRTKTKKQIRTTAELFAPTTSQRRPVNSFPCLLAAFCGVGGHISFKKSDSVLASSSLCNLDYGLARCRYRVLK